MAGKKTVKKASVAGALAESREGLLVIWEYPKNNIRSQSRVLGVRCAKQRRKPCGHFVCQRFRLAQELHRVPPGVEAVGQISDVMADFLRINPADGQDG